MSNLKKAGKFKNLYFHFGKKLWMDRRTDRRTEIKEWVNVIL